MINASQGVDRLVVILTQKIFFHASESVMKSVSQNHENGGAELPQSVPPQFVVSLAEAFDTWYIEWKMKNHHIVGSI